MFGPKVAKARTKAAENPESALTPQRPTLPGRHGQEGGAPDNKMVQKTSSGAAWDFSRIPLYPPDRAIRSRGSSPGIIQRKLLVGQANDPLEHEADRIADQVMRMKPRPSSSAADSSHVSRNSAAGEEEMPKRFRRRNPMPGRWTVISRPNYGLVHGSGSPLPKPRRDFFELRLGHDFTGIRIHSDSRAATLAASCQRAGLHAGPGYRVRRRGIRAR